MTKLGRGALMVSLGSMTLRLVGSGAFGSFVQQHMRWPLIGAAVMLLVLGLYDMLRPDANQSRSVAPWVGWLMLVPIAVLVGVAPTALGSDAAQRADGYQPTSDGEVFPPLPDTDVVAMRLFEFVDRALWDPQMGLEGRAIELEGFIVNDERYPDGVLLTRFMVSCCAADALPLQVAIPTDAPFEDDIWIRATVEWIPTDPDDDPLEFVQAELLEAEVIEDPPDSPYETPF